MTTTRYTYGDTDLAAERLGVVARIFDPTSRAFIEEHAAGRRRLAVDLGCGPGHTTRMLADAAGAQRTVGIDRSENFATRARAAYPELEFIEHDVTRVPFPTGEADLLYGRLLLLHLPDPLEQVRRWATQLAPGGVLLIDEIGTVETEEAVFRDYLKVPEGMLRANGVDLWTGLRLEEMRPPTGTVQLELRTPDFQPDAVDVARMFVMNLQIIGSDPWVAANFEPAEIERIETGLNRIAESGAGGRTRWTLRQFAFQRDAV